MKGQQPRVNTQNPQSELYSLQKRCANNRCLLVAYNLTMNVQIRVGIRFGFSVSNPNQRFSGLEWTAVRPTGFRSVLVLFFSRRAGPPRINDLTVCTDPSGVFKTKCPGLDESARPQSEEELTKKAAKWLLRVSSRTPLASKACL